MRPMSSLRLPSALTTPARRRLAGGAALALVALPLAACGSDDADQASDGGASTSTSTSKAGDGVACNYEADGTTSTAKMPPATAAYDGPVPATITTSAGELKVTLDGKGAPCTVNSFLSLAKQGYFDDTPCHRLTTYDALKVLQCGDPTGTGSGGPGYTIPDELDTAGDYSAGTLAMANTGQPDSGGSQFFIVYADSQLPPTYTVFGKVDAAGVKVVEKVAAGGTSAPEDGAPNTPVSITKVAADS